MPCARSWTRGGTAVSLACCRDSATYEVDEDVDLDGAYLDGVAVFVFVLHVVVLGLDGRVEVFVCYVWGLGR